MRSFPSTESRHGPWTGCSGSDSDRVDGGVGCRSCRAMIYIDTSVALAHLLAEDRHPPDSLWTESLVASRLLEYELWNRLHARKVTGSHTDAARMVLSRVAFLELARPVLERALRPFPVPVRRGVTARCACRALPTRCHTARGCQGRGPAGRRSPLSENGCHIQTLHCAQRPGTIAS